MRKGKGHGSMAKARTERREIGVRTRIVKKRIEIVVGASGSRGGEGEWKVREKLRRQSKGGIEEFEVQPQY